jgi:hypothetical protein
LENQHRLIKGYAELTEEQIARMNAISRVGDLVKQMCDETASAAGIDGQRWVAIARTDLQKGFMALKRAVTNPDTF